MARKKKDIISDISNYFHSVAAQNADKIIKEEENKGTIVDNYSKKLIQRKEDIKASIKVGFSAAIVILGLSTLIGGTVQALCEAPTNEPSPVLEPIPENKNQGSPEEQSQLDFSEESTHDAASFKEQYKVVPVLEKIPADDPFWEQQKAKENESLQSEGLLLDDTILQANENSDETIRRILDAYNLKHNTNIAFDDLGYVEWNGSYYTFKTSNGDYTNNSLSKEYDPSKAASNSQIYSITDADGHVIFSASEIIENYGDEPIYTIIDARTARLKDGTTREAAYAEGDILHNGDINIDNEEIYQALKNEYFRYLERIEEANHNQSIDDGR